MMGLMLALAGCAGDTSSDSAGATSTSDAKECAAPENPYNDDGGHDAGFKWAEEKGEQCDGNSDSFNEGCEEYYRQQRQYEECEAQKHK